MRITVLSDAGFAAIFDRVAGALGANDESVQAQNDAPHIAAAIASLGHSVTRVVLGQKPTDDLASVVDDAPDLVVNLCDSVGGDPQLAVLVPAFLDANSVRHTGGDAFATALCKHKEQVKDTLVRAGLPTPRFQVIGRDADPAAFVLRLQAPVILKLCGEHASVGIDEQSVCFDEESAQKKAAALQRKHAQEILVEEYVGGREFYISCIGRPLRALPLMEHSFTGLPVRTFDKKWLERDAVSVDPRFADPVPLREPVVPFRGSLDDVFDVGALALAAVGWCDWGRVDLRIDKGGVPLVIDVTPMTYLHPEAPCAKAAAAAGLSYSEMWRLIVEGALA